MRTGRTGGCLFLFCPNKELSRRLMIQVPLLRDSSPPSSTSSRSLECQSRTRWERFIDRSVVGGLLEGCRLADTDRETFIGRIRDERLPLLRLLNCQRSHVS